MNFSNLFHPKPVNGNLSQELRHTHTAIHSLTQSLHKIY